MTSPSVCGVEWSNLQDNEEDDRRVTTLTIVYPYFD